MVQKCKIGSIFGVCDRGSRGSGGVEGAGMVAVDERSCVEISGAVFGPVDGLSL